MRLDFSNVGKGLSAIADAKKKRDLARESAKYDVTEGAYGEDLQQNVEQVQGLMRQAQQQAAAQGGTPEEVEEEIGRIEAEYMPSIEELQRRSRMTAPDFTVASRAMRPEDTFATREEATRAARPMRAEGLANVYRSFGDVDEADAMMERAETARLREIQRQTAEFGLSSLQQTAQETERLQAFNAEFDPRMAPEELQELVKKHNLTRRQHLGVLEELNGLETGELAQFESQMKNLIKGKSLSQLVQLYTEDERLDPETGARVQKSRDGKTTLEFFDKASGDVLESQTFGSEALALQALRIRAVEPGQLAEWQLGIRAKEADIGYKEAQTGLRTEQTRAIRSTEANAVERARILEEFEDLSPEEQLGPKGQALQRQFNMVNVRAGGTVPLGGAARAEKPLTPDQDNAWKLLQKSDLFDRAFRANDLPAMRKLLTDRGIPLTVLPGLAAEPIGGGTFRGAGTQTTESAAGATDEPATAQPRPAVTRGEARQNARVRAELNQQFEALPEVQAMIQQLESARAGLRRGGRDDTRALSAQLAQMREQFIAERMGLR